MRHDVILITEELGPWQSSSRTDDRATPTFAPSVCSAGTTRSGMSWSRRCSWHGREFHG